MLAAAEVRTATLQALIDAKADLDLQSTVRNA
jgi:hypothetical protein